MVFYEFCGIVACRKNILVYYIIRTLFNIPPVKILNGVIESRVVTIIKGTNVHRVAITIYAVPFTRRWFVRSALNFLLSRKRLFTLEFFTQQGPASKDSLCP